MSGDQAINRTINEVKMDDISELKFAKLHSPKMKSIYWRHFGFPSNEHDDIITKQNVVCMYCHKVLTNHGNTTNLRAHLQHRHKDLFQRICQENSINVPPRKKPNPSAQVTKRNSGSRRIKMEYVAMNHGNTDSSDAEQAASSAAILPDDDDQTLLYESIVPGTYDDDDEMLEEDDVTNYTAKVEIQTQDGVNDVDNIIITRPKRRRELSIKSEPNKSLTSSTPLWKLEESLVDIVVQDLRNVETLYESGMASFLRIAFVQTAVPTPERIKELIKEQHLAKFELHADFLKMMSHDKHFSLGFDHWTNFEQKRFITMYFNYINDEPIYNLSNQLYMTVEYNEYVSIADILIDFELNNCAAAIFNYEHEDFLKSYLKEQGIPVVLSYDLIIDKCLQHVFGLSEVVDIVEQIKDVIQRHWAEINTKEVEVPIRNEEFLWTYYEWLKFFTDAISWSDDMDILVNSAKMITEAITSLVITLDTLKGEEIPLISMLSPITSKIVSKKLCINEQDEPLAVTLKSTIVDVLQTHVISDENLTIAALLDPRFHRLTTVGDFDGIVCTLKKKFCVITGTPVAESSTNAIPKQSTGKTIRIANVTGCNANSSQNTRKSHLELFFDLAETPKPAVKHTESCVETDLKRYRSEVFVSLDESPLSWWSKMGHIYSSLNQIAPLYQCVPGVVNLNYKKPVKEQVAEYTKRHLLCSELIDAILYLNHHKKL